MITWVCFGTVSRAGLRPQQLARHAEVDDQRVAVVELHDQVLPPPLDARELAAVELLGEQLALPVPPDAAHPVDLDRLDLLADDLLFEIAANHLDLR